MKQTRSVRVAGADLFVPAAVRVQHASDAAVVSENTAEFNPSPTADRDR